MKFETTARTIEYTVETNETYTFRRNGMIQSWCSGCERVTAMSTPESAAAGAGLSLRKMFKQIEAGEIHFLETSYRLLICIASIDRRST